MGSLPRRILDFEDPDQLIVRHVRGSSEQRYLRVTEGSRLATVGLPREQLGMLIERMLIVVDELERRGLGAIDVSRTARAVPDEERHWTEPVSEDFQAGILSIGWDEDMDRLIIEARSHLADEGAGEAAAETLEDLEDEIADDAPIGPDVLRVHLRLAAAQRFIRAVREGGAV